MVSFVYGEAEILQVAAAVEKTASHPIAKAIIDKAAALNLTIPVTRGQLVEPGFGSLANVNGRLVVVGSLKWVNDRFEKKASTSDLKNLEDSVFQSLQGIPTSNNSKTVVYVGSEGEGIIGAIVISDRLRYDSESTVNR